MVAPTSGNAYANPLRMLVREEMISPAGKKEPNLREAQSAKHAVRRVFGPLSLARCLVFRSIRFQGEG